MPGPSDRFQTLSALFDELVRLDPAQREPVIAERCGGDAALESELRALLSADAGDSGGFLHDVVAAEARALHVSQVEGRAVGAWRIVRPIGEGGMGTVYLAERADGAYEAEAAIKLVRGGVASPSLTERFRAERQILAGLSHPGVARLLDGGSTEDGTPYLVMEYVDGLPVTDWCDQQGIDVEARLRLFLRICDAVAYAHRELVAHRDLKPSNILVTADAEPKLLDFGIAKLMDTMSDGSEGVTQDYRLMTPAYASPEQVSGEQSGVAADTYSLGVLLYELLSGRLPIETQGLTPVQLISRVTQDVPPVLSSSVDDRDRKRRLAGDLDAIVSRALRKEPSARYPSVDAMAEDVRLHLGGRPIRTRDDDWRYRTGKLLRKNAGVVSGGLLMLILGVSFTINTLIQARAVGRERDRAEAQRASAERVSDFLEELFSEADPNTSSADDITVREILDRGAARVLTELSDQPESRAALAVVIGRVYNGLGVYDAAEPLLDSALAVRIRMPNVDPTALGEAYQERGVLAYNIGEYERAIELHTSALESFERAPSPDGHVLGGALEWLAVSHDAAGDVEEAERIVRESVAAHRSAEPGASQELATTLKAMEDILRAAGKVDEAVTVGEEALDMCREVYGDDHLETAHALNQLGSSLRDAGRAEEALPYVEEGLALRRDAFDGPHVEIAASLGNLANMLADLGRDTEAIGPRRESVEMLRELFGDDHPYLAGTLSSLGAVLVRADSLPAAEPVLLEAMRVSRRVYPPGHPNLAPPLTTLGTLYRRTGRNEQAIDVLGEAYSVRVNSLPEGHWLIAATGLELGRTYEAMGRDEDADRYLTEAYDLLEATFGPDDERTGQARTALHDSFVRRGLTERAAQLGATGG